MLFFLHIFALMFQAYKYELSPNEAQKTFFNKSFGCARVVYNYCLSEKINLYQTEKKRISQFDLCKKVVLLKRNPDYTWLNEIDHQTLACSVQNLDKAFTRFFREKKGFPVFHSKHGRQSAQFTQGIKVDFEKHKIRFPKIGQVNFFASRAFEGLVKTVTVSKRVDRYFVSILVDNSIDLPVKQPVNETTTVGIDVGIKHFAVLSTGEKFDNPKHLESASKRLAVLQRRLSRKQKGSKRRELAKLKVAKQHYRISCKRNDFLHKLSSKIVAENKSIVIEDLNVAGMMKNHCLARSISSVSWSEFFRQLEYKCEWSGKNLIRIGRFEPSSKMCSCGQINNGLKLSDREWTCVHCGTTHDRDILAANNIKRFGLQKQNLLGTGCAVGDVELLALAGAKKRQVKTLVAKVTT